MLTKLHVKILIKYCLVPCFFICVVIYPAIAQQPQPVLQSGHNPTAIAMRPDGQIAITGGYDGLLKWWDRKTGLLIRSVAAHGNVSAITFNANGTLISSGGSDGFIKVWDVESGRNLLSFRASTRLIKYVTFNPGGDMIASCDQGSYDEAGNTNESVLIHLWDARNGKLINTLQGHTAQVTYIDFNPVGNTLVSASEDKTLKVWAVATGQLIKTIKTDGKNEFVDYSPDGKRIAAVTIVADSKNPGIIFFDAQTGGKLGGFNDNDYWGSRAISANWRYFVATSGQGFKVWSIESGQLVRSAQNESYLSKLAVSADGSTLALDGNSSAVFWPGSDIGGSQPEIPLLGFTTGLAVSRDGRLIAWGSGNEIYVWDKLTAALLYVLKGHPDDINEVAFSPDGSVLASCSNNKVKLWSTSNGAWLGDLAIARGKNVEEYNWNGSQSVSFSPDGKLLVTGETKLIERNQLYSVTLGIRVWDVSTRRLLKYFSLPEIASNKRQETINDKDSPPYWIRSIAFSPDNRTIASDNGSNRIMLLDINTEKFRVLSGHEKEVNSVAFSSDGKRLVSAGFDRTVKLWNVTTGRLIHSLKQHQDRVTTVKFSLDERMIISGSLDHTVKIWDANSGANIATLENHDEAVTSVGVSTDGKTVFSTSIDGQVNLWSLTDRTLLATLVAAQDKSWICFSPSGYYSGNDAEKYLAWRIGNQIYPASRYQAQYFKPGILLAKLNGSPITITTKQPPVVQPPQPQPERGGDVRVRYPGGQTRNVELYKRSYALLIGNSEYGNWNDLPGVQLDMQEVKRALEKQGFKVVSFDGDGEPVIGQPVLDVTRTEFRRQMEQFISIYGQDEDSRLLIYYAGHGYTALLPDGRKMGYLVMHDAPRMPPVEEVLQRPLSSRELNMFYRTSVNMDEIETFAKNITARHALFVFDSCFAGTVLFRDGEDRIPPYINEEITKPVREFLTAGSERQRVLDDSPFRKAFVRGIEGAADTDNGDNPKDGYILASELSAYIKQEVSRYTRGQQTPVFGKILIQELARGDFVFVYRDATGTSDKKISR